MKRVDPVHLFRFQVQGDLIDQIDRIQLQPDRVNVTPVQMELNLRIGKKHARNANPDPGARDLLELALGLVIVTRLAFGVVSK